MGDRDQTKRSVSYSLRYSHNKTLVDTSLAIQVYLLSKYNYDHCNKNFAEKNVGISSHAVL